MSVIYRDSKGSLQLLFVLLLYCSTTGINEDGKLECSTAHNQFNSKVAQYIQIDI
jgi:hypothetical protein